jgi:hypothetical protein
MSLKEELIRRFRDDQNSLRNLDDFNRVSRENYFFLKRIIERGGWPSSDVVGEEGENSAWLIAQHSDFNVDFQEDCLGLIKNLPLTKERRSYISYLSDRIRINKGKKQIFGTQNYNGKPLPIEDMEKLDKYSF